MQWLAIAFGGAAGALARHAMVYWVNHAADKALPWGTLSVNAAGSLLAGAVLALFVGKWSGHVELQSLLVVGFLGSFTTFSAFSVENLQLIQAGQYTKAAVYVGLSVLTCLVAALAGFRWAGAWMD